MYPDEYLIGIQLFNQGDYFESHEVWESLWKATPGAERDFYKGLIQVAVGLCHFANGNVRGARKLYNTSRAHLSPYLPHCMGLNLAELFVDLEQCFQPVWDAELDDAVALDTSRVPRLVLDPPPPCWPAIPDSVFEAEDEP